MCPVRRPKIGRFSRVAMAEVLVQNSLMPIYQYDLAAEQAAPYPPVHQLRTIEADDPYDASRRIANLPLDVPEGSEQVWIRVAIAFNKTDGSVRAALAVPVDASAGDANA